MNLRILTQYFMGRCMLPFLLVPERLLVVA